MARKKIVERLCNHCKGTIKVDLSDIKDVIQYKNFYYHKDCFIERANNHIQKNNRYSKPWAEALDNIEYYEEQTKQKLSLGRPTDKLNDWLLDHYDIVTTPSDRFWSAVRELGNGMYRNKRCKPVSVETLTEAWKWAQPNLDKIAAHNRSINNNITGEARIHYDLAVIVGKLPMFYKHQSKMQAISAETKKAVETRTKINYDSLEKQVLENQNKKEGLGDISSILDELF